jgi:hypothetical protein
VERDPFLRRFERDAAIGCVAVALVVALVPGWGPSAAAGVLGGGGLAAASYLAIKGGVTAALARAWSPWRLVNFFTRYVILAVAAYVMLVRLRLPPVAVFVGASSPVLAALVAAVRFLRPVSRSGHPRS